MFVSGVSSMYYGNNALFEFLFVMLNQKLDFSFFESFIYNKNWCFFPFTSLIPTVVFFQERNYWKSVVQFSN